MDITALLERALLLHLNVLTRKIFPKVSFLKRPSFRFIKKYMNKKSCFRSHIMISLIRVDKFQSDAPIASLRCFLKKHKFICSVAFAIQPLAFLLPFWSLRNISITLFCLVWRISILFNVSLLACLLCRCKLCQSSISEWCLLQKQTNKRIQQFM